MSTKVLVVDDEKSIASAISYALKREEYTVEVAHDGEEAMEKVETFRPQVVVLDVMMPRMNGYEVCRRLEGRNDVGIILLTVKNDVVDKVVGLELGADDYMTKPFEIRELLARVKALARRLERVPRDSAENDLDSGGVKVISERRAAFAGDRQLDLTPKEFDLLAMLLQHPERVYTREELLDLVWGMDYIGGTRTVDIHIQRLRKKLGEPWQAVLQTVYGIGYRASPGAGGET